MSESAKSGDVVARVRASDIDAGANAVLTYSLEGDDHRMFSITPETGVIRLEKDWHGTESSDSAADRETIHHLVVVASDGGAFSRFVENRPPPPYWRYSTLSEQGGNLRIMRQGCWRTVCPQYHNALLQHVDLQDGEWNSYCGQNDVVVAPCIGTNVNTKL